MAHFADSQIPDLLTIPRNKDRGGWWVVVLCAWVSQQQPSSQQQISLARE